MYKIYYCDSIIYLLISIYLVFAYFLGYQIGKHLETFRRPGLLNGQFSHFIHVTGTFIQYTIFGR